MKKVIIFAISWVVFSVSAQEKPVSAFVESKSGIVNFPALSGKKAGLSLTTGVKPLPDGGIEIIQSAVEAAGGLKEVGWKIKFPREYDILIPNGGGRILKWATTKEQFSAEGPMGWEVPLVILQRKEGGYAIWSPDTIWKFHRITISRTAAGWDVTVSTEADAPFDRVTSLEAMRWRLTPHRGPWQGPAKSFRDHLEKNCGFVRTARQKPSWVNEIRAVAYPETDPAALTLLAKRCDPAQTMLYLHNWRQQNFDCAYPDYDRPAKNVKAFIDQAHRLGFRVMLHTNFFSIDVQHPLYPQFEKELIRKADGKKIGWRNARQKPMVASDYVNVASPLWRKLFIARMKEMITLTGADGIHLDQNFHIHQDYNGKIDGMNNIDGSLTFHRELKEALPEIAFGGEGLNGISARNLQFTQRHVFSVMRGTIDREDLEKYHPISSFLFTPYVKLYAWLGIPDPITPEKSQLYAAWYEGYRRIGIIPTLKALRLTPELFEHPRGFLRQQFDELNFWQRERVDYAPDAVWPADADFVFRTATGQPVIRTEDRRLMVGDREISRTVTGVTEVKAPGTVDDWYVYDAERIFGFQPNKWYAYFTTPRNMQIFHVTAMPDIFTLNFLREYPAAIRLDFVQHGGEWSSLVKERPTRVCFEQPGPDGKIRQKNLYRGSAQAGKVTDDQNGPETSGANFKIQDRMVVMSPPARFSHVDSSTGIKQYIGNSKVSAVYRIQLPDKSCRFTAGIAIEGSALGRGKSDGAEFVVTATTDNRTLKAEKFFDARSLNSLWDGAVREQLVLDLTPFRGKTIDLTLAVGPGPFRNATRDDAVWNEPKIELHPDGPNTIELVSPTPLKAVCANNIVMPLPTTTKENYRLQAKLPGIVILLKKAPNQVKPPFCLASIPATMISCGDGSTDKLPPNVFFKTVNRELLIHPPQKGTIDGDYFLDLPAQPVKFTAVAQIMPGHEKSNGVKIRIKVNGETLGETLVKPGAPITITNDMSRFAGKSVRLNLSVDADGDYADDWLKVKEVYLK